MYSLLKIYTQSAYKAFHSTETALVRVHNDILRALDRKQEALLGLLDFSCAFETIDPDCLQNRFSSRFGIGGSALQWLTSYLSGRSQSVSINSVNSEKHNLWCGVPQGSVAGPLLFIMFTTPLQDIVSAHNISCMVYADDMQLYLTLDDVDRSTAVQRMENCLRNVRIWALQNKLSLKKTELLHCHSKYSSNFPQISLEMEESIIKPSNMARNLGVIMDSTLSLSQNVDSICKSAYVAIRKIGKIRRFLDQNSAHRLVHAFVTSMLDCCNSLLFGLPLKLTSKLQRVQNVAARLVSCVSRSSHITPILRKLHWLPITSRITYKFCFLLLRLIMAFPLHICLNSPLDTRLSGLCVPLLNPSYHVLKLLLINNTVNVLLFMQLLFFCNKSPSNSQCNYCKCF